MKHIIEIKNLSKQYENFSLHSVTLNVPKGCIMGLVGENGAGKTTIIKAILNLINKDSGTISVFGKDHIKFEREIKEEIGVLLDDSFFHDSMNAVKIGKIMKQFHQTFDVSLLKKYLGKFNLPSNKPVKEYSRGMKVKLQLACALSHHPKLLILDEPTSGIDPIDRQEILDIFLDFIQDEERTILFSTHITTDLEHIADYVTFIHQGEIILTESKDVLMEEYGVLKCGLEELELVKKEDIIRYQKNRYGYEVLVKNREGALQAYPNMIVDKPSIETIMVLYGKGESI